MLVRVWNRNKFDHVETFKEKQIKIKAGEYILMDREEAIEFAGKYFRPKFDGNDVQLPQTYKMIEVEGKYGPAVELPVVEQKFKCIACGHVCLSERELAVHLEDKHAEQVAHDEEAEAAMKSDEALAAEVKRGPGRPRKD